MTTEQLTSEKRGKGGEQQQQRVRYRNSKGAIKPDDAISGINTTPFNRRVKTAETFDEKRGIVADAIIQTLKRNERLYNQVRSLHNTVTHMENEIITNQQSLRRLLIDVNGLECETTTTTDKPATRKSKATGPKTVELVFQSRPNK